MPKTKEEKAAYMKQYHETNKEKIAIQKKKWRGENKEKIAAHNKKYRVENKEIIAAKKKITDKQYRETNKEKIAIQKKKWREENNEEVRKRETKTKWKMIGLICEDIDSLYCHYVSETHCDFCRVKFGKKGDGTGTFKCMDHSHKTGLFRNFLCNSCNIRRGE